MAFAFFDTDAWNLDQFIIMFRGLVMASVVIIILWIIYFALHQQDHGWTQMDATNLYGGQTLGLLTLLTLSVAYGWWIWVRAYDVRARPD